MLYFYSERSHNQIPVWWQVNLQNLSLPHPKQGIGDGRLLFCPQTLPIHAQLLVSGGCPIIHACTNNFRLTSGEVFNYCIKWSKASFAFSIADIQEENNVLHICWLYCNTISIHLVWHGKEQAFVVWFWAKPTCLDALLFREFMHKELKIFHSSILR